MWHESSSPERILFCYQGSSDHQLHLTYESVELEILKGGFNDILLLKTLMSQSEESDYIFVPLELTGSLNVRRLKSTTNSQEYNKQLQDFIDKWKTKDSGFIIPLKHLSETYIYSGWILSTQINIEFLIINI